MFLSVLTSAFSAFSTAHRRIECCAAGMAWYQALWGVYRSIRTVFALRGFTVWLGKWDICAHMENEITKQEVSDNTKQ